jgi:glucose/arabinose dehydrogenase
MRLITRLGIAACGALMLTAGAAQAEIKVKLEPFVTGVNTPLMMAQPPGDDRIFVIEQFGRIRIIKNGKLRAEPFLDIRNKIVNLHHDFDERGLLGLAFHPNFKDNGKFYIAYSGHLNFQQDLAKMLWYSHTNTVAEFQVSKENPNAANPNSERIISAIAWPQFNHNGHWIGFGKDGYLYISTGDGGYANDWGIGHHVTKGNGQDLRSWNGKMLRIDVNKTSGDKNYAIPSDNPFVGNSNALPEIWAYGLRNPWRCSFDMGGDALICGDVQQNSYEEVSIIPKGGNLGWRKMEATHCFDYTKPDEHPSNCDKSGLTLPVLEYPNCTAKPKGCKGISVTGGYIYRGAVEAWKGKYIFGDWSKSFAEMDGQLFMATKGSDGKWSMDHIAVTNMSGKLPYVLAFGQDAKGEVYALTSITTGPNGSLDTIYKIVPAN